MILTKYAPQNKPACNTRGLGFKQLFFLGLIGLPTPLLAWGDLGHEIIAGIAWNFLTPESKNHLTALLHDDQTALTPTDPISVAVWADRWREDTDQTGHNHFQQTHLWHFIDLERTQPNITDACFNHPPLTNPNEASDGPANDCIIDKIQQFLTELNAYQKNQEPKPTRKEAQMALKFIIHFVGDLHQPLHAITDHDRGGNDKKVLLNGSHSGSLHHYWDTTFVEYLGSDPAVIATQLSTQITPNNIQHWQAGTLNDWAMESFHTAVIWAYDALPPPNEEGHYLLNQNYATQAEHIIPLQLEEAGIRLAYLLNKTL